MIINDDEQLKWSATFPLDTTDDEEKGELLRRLYAKLDSVTEYKNSLAAEIEVEWDFNLCHNNISIDCKVDYLPMATTTNDSTQSSLSLNKHSNLSLY